MRRLWMFTVERRRKRMWMEEEEGEEETNGM
jgi:hypothetical protein